MLNKEIPDRNFKIVIVESPFAGNVEGNIKFARACMRDCLLRDEAPYASHLLYTQEGVLNDSIQEERELGIYAGFAFKQLSDVMTVFYDNKGWSWGMKFALKHCKEHGMRYEIRHLTEDCF